MPSSHRSRVDHAPSIRRRYDVEGQTMGRDGGSAFGPNRAGRPAVGKGERRRRHPLLSLLLSLIVLGSFAAGVPALAQETPPIVPVDDQAAALEPEEPAAAEVAAAPAGPAAAPSADWSPPTTVYVPETGHTVDGVFLDLWRGWGAANGFGNPITPEIEENGRVVQYYGYARLEYWPEDPEGQVVRFGDIGAEMRPHLLRRGLPGDGEAATAAARLARAWIPSDDGSIEPDGVDWQFMSETGHGVAGEFKTFWEATGGAAFLGNPLSQPYDLAGVTYQAFERGLIAQEAGGSPYLVPAGELAAARRGLDTAPVAQADVPTYSEELFVPPPDPTPTPTVAGTASVEVDPNAEKWFQVSIGQQYGIARQGDVVLWEGYLSTGKPGFETPTGTYFVNTKLPVQDMEGVIGGEYYNVPEVPSVMYFTDRGHAIHGTYWHANFGTPMSHGCINLPMDVAAWLYDWAPVGLRVEIVP
jgi:lipoprotein-anchoring transpeptidase ErfK/SrfK